MKFALFPDVRWYDVPNFVLNHVTVAEHAHCFADLCYAADPRQMLDLYVPKQVRADGALVVFVHGGSWQHGNKEDYIFLAQNLAKSGFYVACINYRLAPQHIYPDYVQDVILACNWLSAKVQAETYGYCAKKLILMGHSAGAFNVMATLYHPEWSCTLTHPDAIFAVVALAGPYSFEHRGDPVAKDAFDQQIAPEAIMPNHFVYPNAVRHLLLLAGKDRLVGDYNTERMYKALLEVNNQVQVMRIKATSHVSIIATLARGLDRIFSTKDAIVDFIDR